MIDKKLLYALLSMVAALAVALWLIDATVYDVDAWEKAIKYLHWVMF